MIIGFDLDGVIADHTEAKINIASSLGFAIQKKDTPSDILKTILPDDIWLELQQILFDEKFNYDIKKSQSFLMDGVEEFFKILKLSNIDYFLISRRKIPSSGENFLKQNNLWPQYFDSSNAFFVREIKDKDLKAAKLGVTHFVDDQVSVLNGLKSVENRFLFDQHNVFPSDDFYTKVSSWEEIKKQLLI